MRRQSAALTCDAAEQTQAGSTVAPLAARMAFCRSRGHGDGHGDGLVELPPPGLHGDDGAKGGSVPQDAPHQLVGHRLGLSRGGHTQRSPLCKSSTFP